MTIPGYQLNRMLNIITSYIEWSIKYKSGIVAIKLVTSICNINQGT